MGRADLLSQSGLAASSGAIKRRGCGRACIGADVPQVEGTGGPSTPTAPLSPLWGKSSPSALANTLAEAVVVHTSIYSLLPFPRKARPLQSRD